MMSLHAQKKEQVLYPPSSQDATAPAASVVAGLTEPGNPRKQDPRATIRVLSHSRLPPHSCPIR
ncbi:MAG: hypothetical protein WCI46_15900, partial [Verrucomicrobiota bacterium]